MNTVSSLQDLAMPTETNMARSSAQEAQSETPIHANGSDSAVIDQVRELLFGETKRSTENGLGALEARIRRADRDDGATLFRGREPARRIGARHRAIPSDGDR